MSMSQNQMTLQRILFESGCPVSTLVENIKNTDGTTLSFRLKLAGCETEQEVIDLVNQYI